MEQLGSYKTDFHEIYGKSVKKIQVLLKLTRIMGALHDDL